MAFRGLLDDERSLSLDNEYSNSLAQANAIESRTKKNPSGLGAILAGIGEKVGDVFGTLGNIGQTVAGAVQNNATNFQREKIMDNASAARDEIAKRYGFNSYSDALSDANADKLTDQFWADIKNANNQTSKDINDLSTGFRESGLVKDIQNKDLNKAKGQALSTIGTVFDFAPGGGVVGNVISGAFEGVGDAYKNASANGNTNGNIDLADALTRAAINASTAGATGGLASKLGAGKTFLGSVGKSALTGAAGGALSAGATDFAQNQDINSALSSAVQGAQTGALGGAVMGGANALANKAINSLRNKTQQVDAETTQKPIADNTTEAEATGWGEKDMTNAAKKRNAAQKLGDTLKETGQMTEDSGVYSKLKGNTAEEMAGKNAVQRLRELGYEPSDYKQAANLSEVANKAYSDLVSKSTKTADLPSVYKLAGEIADDLNMSVDQKEVLIKDITKRLDAARLANGKGLATFDAKGLEDVADALGKKSKKMTTTSQGGSKANNGTLSPDDAKYAQALDEVKKSLRGEVNDLTGTGYNKKALTAKLKAAGATDKQISYLTQDGNLSGLKARTSLLEDARTMERQMRSDALKRGANATNSTSLPTQLANATGASGLLDIVTTPVRKVVGKAEKVAGRAVGAVGDALAGQGAGITGAIGNIAGKAGDVLAGANTDNLVSQMVNKAALRNVAETAGREVEQANNNAQLLDQANQIRQEAETQYALGQQQMASQQTSPGQEQLNRIANAMELALNAGDLTSYSKLADLYSQAYKMYGASDTSANSLNATQQNNIAKLKAAGSAIDRLESLFNQAGGGQGRIGGGLAEALAGAGLNNNVSAYNTAARGLINQIAAAVGKTDSLNTEGEVQRALDLVPKITDTAEEAQIKLQSLREMLQANQQTYNELYGLM